jgi:hypothetical protein
MEINGEQANSASKFDDGKVNSLSMEPLQCSSSSNLTSSNQKLDDSTIAHNSKLYVGGEWINVPSILLTNVLQNCIAKENKLHFNIFQEFNFRSAVNKESFNSLSQAAKDHLKV